MQNNENIKTLKAEKKSKKKRSFKRWYSFNKQRIPLYFILIAVIFFTATLDFTVTGTPIVLKSHIESIKELRPEHAIASFYLFMIYLLSIIQIPNGISFAKKKSPFSLILLTVITLAQTVFVLLYSNSLLNGRMPTIAAAGINTHVLFSVIVFIVGLVLAIAGNVFAWIYVDWKYKKIEE